MFKEKIRYILAGAWNTAFGYSIGILLYASLEKNLHIIFIGLIANVISISMAFISYKLFVFKTRGKWYEEYIKCYIVYGGNAIISTLAIWILVDKFAIKFWVAQAIIIVSLFFISFFAHKRFTFNTIRDE